MSARQAKLFGFPQQRPTLFTSVALLLSLYIAGACLAQQESELFGGSAAPTSDDESEAASPQAKAAQAAEASQRRHQELLQQRQNQQVAEQHAQAEQAYRKAMSEYEEVLKQNPQLGQQRAMLEQQMKQLEMQRAALAQQMTQMQAAEMAAHQQAQRKTPPPKDAEFKVFALRHSRAPEIGRVLSEILDGAVQRMAIDERTNSLLVLADKNTTAIVEALVTKLDESADGTIKEKAQFSETLQVRIVWLLDIDEGMEATDKLVSPQVVEALGELGFEHPKVVCQQVTTLTLGEENRRGQFHFQVPVLIQSQPWQFEGQGQIEPMADSRFNLKFDLGFKHMNTVRGGGPPPGGYGGHLGGSIYTPLAHYTVMGTTTFVESISNNKQLDSGQAVEREQQHLSAFVVYLDRAREFPAPRAQSEKQDDVRR
jgi:hypothetical protein